MVADTCLEIYPNITENENDVSKTVKPMSAFQKRLLELKKPLNLTKSATPEIELDVAPKTHQVIDAPTKWLMDRTGFKNQPTKSPKVSTSPKNKYQKKKQELCKRLVENTRQEQAKRYKIFNADNENFEKTNDDDFDNFDLDDEEELLLKNNKEADSEVSEEELDEDDELVEGEEDEDEGNRNEFVNDAASEDEEAGYVSQDCPESERPANDSDVDDDQFLDAKESNLNDSDAVVDDLTTQSILVNVPNCPSQMIEPEEFEKDLLESESQQNTNFDHMTTMDELMDLCSGGFADGIPLSNGTNSSSLDVLNYLPEKTPTSTPSRTPSTSVHLANSCDDTFTEIERFMELYDKAEDTVLAVDSDSDSDEIKPPPRKRKIVNYSDDDDDNEDEEKKKPKLFDSDEESVNDSVDFIEEPPALKNKNRKPLIDLGSDFITTEDPSNLPAATNEEYFESRRWITDENDDGNDQKNDLEENAKFFDDEAELSGDDVGSSDDEADEADNEYEHQECDDEVYDEEELRNDLAQQLNKQVQDEEYRRLRYLQEKLIGDDLQGDDADRSFRYRLKKEISEDDWQKLVKLNPILATMDWEEPEDQDDEIQKNSIEVHKWKHRQIICNNDDEDENLDIMADFGDSPLLAIGRQVMTKTTVQTRTAMTSRDSLLGKNNFNLILKETQNVETKSHTLFTLMPKPHLEN